MALWWLVACVSDKDEGSSDLGPSSGDTGSTTPDFVLGCRPDPDNAVRAVCGFDRDGTGPISVTLEGAGEAPRTFEGDPDLLIGEVVGWGLLQDTDWTWTMTDRGEVIGSGTFRTPTLPLAYDPIVDLIVPGPSSVDHTLFSLSCGRGPALFVLDAQNRVRWYQDAGDRGFISAFEQTDRGTVAALMDRSLVGEWAFDGTEVTSAEYPDLLPHRVHHAVEGSGGALRMLDAQLLRYSSLDYVIDGITEVRDGAATHVWDVRQILDPVGQPGELAGAYWLTIFPTGIDFAHMNSFDTQDDGGFFLTLKHLDTIARVNADGTLRWHMYGERHDTLFFGPEMAVSSSAGLDAAFQHPHHVNTTPWGTVLVFDNGDPRTGATTARAVEMTIDEDALTADVIRAWDLGVSCPVQSSVFPLSDGSLLAACAAAKQTFELDDTGIRRNSSISCRDGGPATSFVRVQPIAFP